MLGEDGHHPRLSRGVLPGTVYVWVAQDGVIEAVETGVKLDVFLSDVLGQPVGRKGPDGVILPDRKRLRLSIGRAPARDEDDLADPELPAKLQEVDRPQDVLPGIVRGVFHRLPDVYVGGMVVDPVRPLAPDDGPQGGHVAKVHSVERCSRV